MKIKTTGNIFTSRVAKIKKPENTKCCKEHGTITLLYIVVGSVNLYNYFGKLFGSIY